MLAMQKSYKELKGIEMCPRRTRSNTVILRYSDKSAERVRSAVMKESTVLDKITI